MQGEKKDKLKLRRIIEKSKRQSQQLRHLQGQIYELRRSRLSWKEKSKLHLKDLRELEKRLNKKEKKRGSYAKGHSYSSESIALSLQLRKDGKMSLRSVVSVLKILVVVFGLELRIPSHESISLWERRVGLSGLESEVYGSTQYAIIVDESIRVGKEKILLILGVNLEEYKFGAALKFSDVEVLSLGVKESWTGEQISEELETLKSKGLQITYGVSDKGPNIVKAFRISELLRISDCTHAFGKLLEKQYKTAANFIEFSSSCGKMCREYTNGRFACFVPPKQRTKGRFLNISPLSKWGKKMLRLYDFSKELDDQERAVLAWLVPHRNLISQLNAQCELIDDLSQVIKLNGLNTETVKTCNDMLQNSIVNEYFTAGIKGYLQVNFIREITQDSLICTSDIIESIFGKYENSIGDNPQNGITSNCLNIVNYTKEITPEKVTNALNKTKVVDLKQWKTDNLKEQIQQKKKALINNCR